MMKKIVISPTNKKAIAFFEELSKRKDESRKRIESKLIKAASLKQKEQ
jgi:hypothetical protein